MSEKKNTEKTSIKQKKTIVKIADKSISLLILFFCNLIS